MRQKLDFERLKEYCDEYKITLVSDYENSIMFGKTIISGKCLTTDCPNNFNKRLRDLIYKNGNEGAFCNKCTQITRLEKIKKTCLKKYGVESPFNDLNVKEQIKQTFLRKYNCENPLKNKDIQERIKNTNVAKYGVDFIMKNVEFIEKRKVTFLKKYGLETPSQSEKVKLKSKNTCLEKYGFKNVAQNAVVKEKIKKTNIERYGVSTPLKNDIIKEKVKNTNLEKYGCENPMQSVIFRDKAKQTCLTRYGCEHVQQNAIISERTLKSSYKTKQYTLPSGNVLQLQGYEPYAINDLLNIEKLSENDIITSRSEVPETWYIDETGKKHRYFVDIYIPNQKRCVEVKSVWTMKQNPKIIFDKQAAIKNNGYSCEIWVYNNKGERLKKYD
jgi:hypothetical protein